MAADPRGTRPRSTRIYQNWRAAKLHLDRQHQRAGTTFTCSLCGQPVDLFQPYRGGRNPRSPSLQHPHMLDDGGAIIQADATWDHKRCQDRQGADRTNLKLAARRRRAKPRPQSQRW